MRRILELVLTAFVFSAGSALGGQPAETPQLHLESVADSPDPFSPPVAGKATIKADFDVRVLGNDVDGKYVSISRVLRGTAVVRNAAGQEVRRLYAEQEVERGAVKCALKARRVTLAMAWDGRDAAGTVVPDSSMISIILRGG
jgi:hypothetical protein